MPSVKRIAVIDCQLAGISGDMMVGALLDLDVNTMRVIEAMKRVKDHLNGCKSLEITVKDVVRRGFRAKKVNVKSEEEVKRRTGAELINATKKSIKNLNLSDEAKQFTLNSVNTLINAEAKIHGESAGEVHLHEAGSADTIADIVGTAVALEDLNLFKDTIIYSTPVAVGGGLFKFSHGIVPSPAPATVEILRSKGFPMVGGPVDSELATPTGVSLFTNLAHRVTSFYPSMKPTAVGYGAGTKDFPEMPNVLRITLGEEFDYGLLCDEIYVLETNLDDVTGEIIGHTIDRLLQEGARDVSVIPMFTKKSRPGQVIKIIADQERAQYLSRILMEETGTLGVRVYPCKRYILARESVLINVEVEGIKESVNVKVARDREGRIVQMKPEYDEVRRLANKTGKPLREIIELVKMKAREVLLER